MLKFYYVNFKKCRIDAYTEEERDALPRTKRYEYPWFLTRGLAQAYLNKHTGR